MRVEFRVQLCFHKSASHGAGASARFVACFCKWRRFCTGVAGERVSEEEGGCIAPYLRDVDYASLDLVRSRPRPLREQG